MFEYQLISTISGRILSSLELLYICPTFFHLISEKLTCNGHGRQRSVALNLRPLKCIGYLQLSDRSQKYLARGSRGWTTKEK